MVSDAVTPQEYMAQMSDEDLQRLHWFLTQALSQNPPESKLKRARRHVDREIMLRARRAASVIDSMEMSS